VPGRRAAPEPVARIAERLRDAGRVGLTARDADRMKDLLPTRSDRVLYERSMERLGASDPAERLRAVRALEALGSKASAPLLAAALGREPDAGVKVALLGALARFEEPFAAGLAERERRDPRPSVRIAALEALAAVSDARAHLAAALGDESPLVRRRAALLLGFAPGPEAEEALAGALSDPDGGVARAAAAALSGRPSARAQTALARALEHADGTVRRAAAGALGRWSGERVDADAPAHARRQAARRIAERLAAMGGGELRDAVLSAAPSAVVEEAPSPRPPPPPRGGEGEETRTAAAAAIAAHRTAVAVLEDPGPAAPGPGFEAAVLAEIRAALRGCTADDLAGATGEPRARVDAALQVLAARGVLSLRGTRWFTS
jgi:HEAT repeat protein